MTDPDGDHEGDADLYVENGTCYVRTQAGVAALLGVNRRTVADYARQGMPGKPGRYPTADICHWYAEKHAGRPICRECWRSL